jgi:hypothetical protein
LDEVYERWYYNKPTITTWRDLKELLRNKYAPQAPPELLQQAPSQESPKEATKRALGGFTQTEAVLAHNNLPTTCHSVETNEKPPEVLPPVNTRGNYLDSQKRRRANSLSLGADCTISVSKPFQEKKISLVPLPPDEVYLDKTKLKGKQE